MIAKSLTLAKLIIDSMWSLATGWTLPGFVFNFATLAFGCLVIVHIALPLIGDFLVHFGVRPFDTSGESMEGRIRRQTDMYNKQEQAWWDYYDSKYGG